MANSTVACQSTQPVTATQPGRMTESAGAFAILKIEDHIVIVHETWPHRHVVEMELMTHLPRDYVVRAGGIAAEPQTTDTFALRIVERQATAKNNDAADRFSYYGVVRRAERSGTTESRFGVGWRAGCQAVQALPRLRGRKDICGGDCIIVIAQTIRRVCLGSRNHATAWPFLAAAGAAEHDCTTDAIVVHNHCPFLITQAAILAWPLFHDRCNALHSVLAFGSDEQSGLDCANAGIVSMRATETSHNGDVFFVL